ncbi:MAG: amino acid adenylation domain-containing protein [Phycisphaerales bacterium JB060]
MAQRGTINQHLSQAFAQHADRAAIEEWPSGRTLTYAELDASSVSLAAHLSQGGIGPGSLVPLVMPRSTDYLICIVAILRCGAAYAPIDPAAPRREAMLQPLGSPVVLGSEPGMLNPADIARRGSVPHIDAKDDIDPDAPAYVMYTSGTTGAPKGVLVPHRAVVRLVIDADFASFGPDHRWGVMSATAFDASTLEIWGALLHGGCCVVQTLPTPGLDDLAGYFTAGRVDDTWLTASLFNAMVDEHPRSMAGMRQLLTGGERESMPHIRRFKKACPGVTLIHGYGPTENTTFSLCHTISEADARGNRIPIGTPIHGSTMRIIEPGAGPDAPPAPLTEGELLVGGEGLALGYLGDQAKTDEKFVTDRDGTRWYHTGDTVTLRDDGAAVFTGRIDRQVKIRGHRIEPDGIERELAACAGVDQAAIAVMGHTAETRKMVAFFVSHVGVTETEVRDQLARRVPPTQMPERFMAIGAMPVGATGKADRVALIKQLENDAPNTCTCDTTSTKATLIDLFAKRLGRSIDPNERFRDVGGHSLLAMRLSTDVRRELGVALPAAEILRRQTINAIAELIPTLPAVAPLEKVESPDTIGDIRRRTSLEHARDGTAKAMLVHHAWHVTPAIEPDRLRLAWLSLLDRHDALRTSVAFSNNGPRLVQHDPHTSTMFHAEHDRLGAPDPSDPRVRRASERTIGPGDAPARMHVWPIADGSQFILLVLHHAAIDEWSLEILSQELDDLLKGRELDPAPPYSAFVRAEHQMRSTRLASSLAERIAGGDSPIIELPPSGPQRGLNHVLQDPGLTAEALDARARSLGVGPASLAAAALGLVLQSHYGEPGRWLLTPFARRPSEDLQRVVGCCLDMRLLEANGDTLEDTAWHVHEQMLTAQEDRTLPLEVLIDRVRAIQPARAGDATRFGLTYRHIDDSPRTLGDASAVPVTIAQPAARFGLCMHVERRQTGLRVWLEASADHYTDAAVASIGHRVLDLLLDRATAEPGHHAPPTATALPASTTISDPERSIVAELWSEFLGVTPHPGSDFFRDGGTSLTAMRLAAAIHKRIGRRLMLNQFLHWPTLDGLMHSIRDDAEHPYAEFSDIESEDYHSAAPWSIAIPGSAGRAIDLHRLWLAVGDKDRSAMDMLAFDLATIATGETESFDTGRFFARFTALAHAYAMTQDRRGPITLVGYSLGGLVAMDMAARLAELGHNVERVVLLDAYAPQYLSRTLPWYLAKANARLRTLGRRADPPAPIHHDRDAGDAHADEANRAAWKAVHRTLAGWQPPPLTIPVLLIRSAPAWQHLRPAWHSATNGLGPWLRGEREVRVLDIPHLAMLTSGADRLASETRDALTIKNPATPAPPDAPRQPIEHHPARP